MEMLHYILDEENKPQKVKNVIEWAEWFEKSRNRFLFLTEVGKYEVSTVFLGLDHNFGAPGKPILFETMVFAKEPVEIEFFGRKRMSQPELKRDWAFNRYTSSEEAEKGHQEIVEKVQELESEGLEKPVEIVQVDIKKRLEENKGKIKQYAS